ncbi:MAG: hypothetical protein N3A38_06265 [Planctomycetota bacterium]|nr:hypothetical protein [Planctomycetota bacterium]
MDVDRRQAPSFHTRQPRAIPAIPALAAYMLATVGCGPGPETAIWDPPPSECGRFVPHDPDSPRNDIARILDLPDEKLDVIETAMALAREVRPEADAAGALRLARELAEQVREETAGCGHMDEAIECILEKIPPARPGRNRLDEFDPELLARGEAGSCLGTSLLVLGIARRLGLPVRGVAVPGHFFLRCYYPDGRRRNLDLTRPCDNLSDAFYVRWRRISERAIMSGIYLRGLTDREVIGHLLASRAGCLAQEGKIEMALRDADLALRLLPGNPQALINRGFALDRMGREAEAAESYRLAIRSDPASSRAMNNLAHILCRSPASPLYDPVEARELAQAAVRLDPYDPDYRATAADAFAALRRWREAVRFMADAARLAPDNAAYQARWYALRDILREEVRAGREGPYGFRLPPSPVGR